MPTDHLRARLTVYFDGQFWIGFFEREDAEGLSIARHVFGPEPALPQIAELVAGRAYSRLRFIATKQRDARGHQPAANPKRRQREAAREAKATAPSTRSQEALKAAIEERKTESAAQSRERKAEAAHERWEQRVAKRKEKKRGH
jgi:hypothetical protein